MAPTFDSIIASRRGRTLIMGILNVTPDSFSDGGRYLDPRLAFERARRMAADGADIIDLGGESTRPGAKPVSEQEELDRVLPVARLIQHEMPGQAWSIDTQKAGVARQAVALGACLINDISGLQGDEGMAETAAQAGCGLVLMHRRQASQAAPWSTEEKTFYPGGVAAAVRQYLLERAAVAERAGVRKDRIWLDPGFGFGKTVADNLSLLKHGAELLEWGYGILIGASRKSSLGAVLGGLPPEERLEATAASVALNSWQGITCVRVHDVKEMARVVRVVQAIKEAP